MGKTYQLVISSRLFPKLHAKKIPHRIINIVFGPFNKIFLLLPFPLLLPVLISSSIPGISGSIPHISFYLTQFYFTLLIIVYKGLKA